MKLSPRQFHSFTVQRGVVVGDLVHLVQHVVAGDVEKRLRVTKLCAVRLYNMVLCGKCRFAAIGSSWQRPKRPAGRLTPAGGPVACEVCPSANDFFEHGANSPEGLPTLPST